MAKPTVLRLEELKRRTLELVPKRDGCVCRLIHIIEGETLTEEERATVEANRLCIERHSRSRNHVGYNTVIIAQQMFKRDDDDAPLIA
jgi:hypothetical protein